ncbi:hypothetical protein [Paraburkholderia madseniana]|uniref:hypothetical protein n=1 Tax=Paraburkholderia madseniana TaxID=2599607 RepID=UPI0018EC0D36|nr:hypothetical protein [Paraburkholderia madseniana]
MKRLLTGAFALLLSIGALGTTLNPIQLLNPTGSTSGQAVVSTGSSTPPAWANVAAAALASQAANSVVANVTGSAASPTAFAMPSCSATGNALNYTSGTGWTCATGYALLASPTFTGTPAAPTATFGTNTTQIATTAFVQAAIGSAAQGKPYFQAYRSTNQILTANTIAKIQFDTKNFDSGTYYDNSTNYRFTPLIAGKYEVHVVISFVQGTSGAYIAAIYKNGSILVNSQESVPSQAGNFSVMSEAIVNMNGTTDYLEGWGQTPGTTVNGASPATYFEAYYIGP